METQVPVDDTDSFNMLIKDKLFVLDKVIYSPTLVFNLISVSQMRQVGSYVFFRQANYCFNNGAAAVQSGISRKHKDLFVMVKYNVIFLKGCNNHIPLLCLYCCLYQNIFVCNIV